MKKMHILMSCALIFVGTAMYSCVDDDESNETKAIRQAEVDSRKADVEKTYRDLYASAESSVKTRLEQRNTYQKTLDDYKSGRVSKEEAQQIAIDYYEKLIAAEEAKIEVYEKTYSSEEDVIKDYAAAKSKYDVAKYNADNYWIKITNEGYNQSSVTVTDNSSVYTKIDALLGSTYNYSYSYYNPKNYVLQNLPFVEKYVEVYSNAYEYTYNGSDPSTALKSEVNTLVDGTDTYYTYYTYKYDIDEYNTYITKLKEGADNNNFSKEKYNEIVEIFKVISNSYAEYVALINKFIAYAQELHRLDRAKSEAYNEVEAYEALYNDAIRYDYYFNTYATNSEISISTSKRLIASYKQEIENAKNAFTDNETSIKYYEALIAEIDSEIEFYKELAALYRSRLEALIPATTTTAE